MCSSPKFTITLNLANRPLDIENEGFHTALEIFMIQDGIHVDSHS